MASLTKTELRILHGVMCYVDREKRTDLQEFIKVNFTLEEDMKAQRGSRGIVLLFL